MESKPMSYLVKDGDKFYVVNYSDESVRQECGITKDGLCLTIPTNDSNRKFYMLAKAEADIADTGRIDLTYKASKSFGPRGDKLPNEKLISYLSEDEQAEYKAIIERARQRMLADKSNVEDVDKLKARLEKAKAQYEKLLAMVGNDNAMHDDQTGPIVEEA